MHMTIDNSFKQVYFYEQDYNAKVVALIIPMLLMALTMMRRALTRGAVKTVVVLNRPSK